MGIDRPLGGWDDTYHFHSSLASHANISAVNLEGVGHAAHIYLDSLLIEHGPEGLTFMRPWIDMVTCIFTKHGRYFYAEFDVVGGDYTGDTRETLHLMHCYHYATDPYGLLTDAAGTLHALGIGHLWWYGESADGPAKFPSVRSVMPG